MKNQFSMLILVGLLFLCCSRQEIFVPEIVYNGSSYIKINSSNVHDSIYIETRIISRFPIGERKRKNVLITNDEILFLQFQLTKPEIVEFTVNTKSSFRTYLNPGDTLSISFSQSSKDSIHYITNYFSDNNIFKYCQEKFNKLGYVQFIDESSFRTKYWFRLKISQDIYNKGLLVVDSLEKQDHAFLENYSNELPDWFVRMERSNIQYSAAYCKISLFGNLKDNKQKENLKVSVPLHNEDAILSSHYYSFLNYYFLYGYPSDSDPMIRLINSFNKEYPEITASLKESIRDYYVTCYIADLYSFCISDEEFEKVDSFFKSKDFSLTTEELEYIDQRRLNFLNSQIPYLSLDSGLVAPDFEIKGVNGLSHKLSDLKGKMIYLHFWATWCGPCISEMPTLNKLADKLDLNEVIVVNVCLDNEIYKVNKIISQEKLPGLNLICDEYWSKKITTLYNISAIPHYTLIDENGRIIKNKCDRPGAIYDYIKARL